MSDERRKLASEHFSKQEQPVEYNGYLVPAHMVPTPHDTGRAASVFETVCSDYAEAMLLNAGSLGGVEL